MRVGIAFAALAAASGFVAVAAGPASASVTCVKSGSTLAITMPAGTRSAELYYAPDGSVGVETIEAGGTVANYCIDQVDQSVLHSIELFEDTDSTPTAWSLRQTDWQPDIVIHDDATDTFTIHQPWWVEQPPPAQIQAVASATGAALSLDGDPSTSELLLDQPPTLSTFELIKSTDDVVDLSVGDATFPGNTVIRPGPGADVVEGGAGDDHVYLDEDSAVDAILGGGSGTDVLSVSTPDYLKGAVIDPTSPGGDGVSRQDDYGSFERYVGSDGPDHFVAPPTGAIAVGGYGADDFVSGPGDDVFYGLDEAHPYSNSDGGTADYSLSAGPITAGPTSSPGEDLVTGDGTDRLVGISGIVGSPYADTVSTSAGALVSVRPGDGNDTVVAGTETWVVAEPTIDGDDLVTSNDHPIGYDYTLRTAAVSLTADGVANDGGAGEHDNLVGPPGVRILGGSGNDVIVGDRGPNWIAAGDGDDDVRGLAGRDGISGYAGDDRLDGGSGDDVVDGYAGDDVLVEGGAAATNGSDELDGWDGIDTVTYAGRARAVSVTIDDAADDGAPGEGDYVGDIERVIGTAGDDHLSGSGAAETLEARGGDDVLRGKGGIDVLLGNGGNDRFYARDGLADLLRGGSGTDRAIVDEIDVLSSVEAFF